MEASPVAATKDAELGAPVASELTPLRPGAAKANYKLAMARAKLRLPRDPDTNSLYPLMGLCAPSKAFEVLGQQSAVHVRIVV